MKISSLRKITLIGIAVLLLTYSVPIYAATSDVDANIPIDNFRVVTSGEIFRGARPDDEGVTALVRDLHVKTDLDLENDSDAVAHEEIVAKDLGIHFVSLPMSGFYKPVTKTVDAALAVLADPTAYPVFVHCKHGQDRTGLIVGLHRVFAEKWTPEKAYQEMRDDGFHPLLFFLRDYFFGRTGYDPKID